MIDEHAWVPPGVETWGALENLAAWLAGDLAMTERLAAARALVGGLRHRHRGAGRGSGVADRGQRRLFRAARAATRSLRPGSRSRCRRTLARIRRRRIRSPNGRTARRSACSGYMLPYALRDPFRTLHFTATASTRPLAYAGEYLDAPRARAAETGLLDLSIQQPSLYEEALTRAITASVRGRGPAGGARSGGGGMGCS